MTGVYRDPHAEIAEDQYLTGIANEWDDDGFRAQVEAWARAEDYATTPDPEDWSRSRTVQASALVMVFAVGLVLGMLVMAWMTRDARGVR